MSDITITDYIVIRKPDQHNSYWVSHDGMSEPYDVDMQPTRCNCPHWVYRLRQPGRRCRHHKIVEMKEAVGAIL